MRTRSPLAGITVFRRGWSGRAGLAAALAYLLIACNGARPANAQTVVDQTPVDLELALSVDVSSSVTLQEYNLQMIGIAAAFRHPDVIAAIENLQPSGIAVCLIHWSGSVRQKVAVAWALVKDGPTAKALARRIENVERSFIGETSVGRALAFSAREIATNGFSGRRMTIDLSGDGDASYGPRARKYRDEIVEHGITINALAILADDPGLADYYRDNVIGGPGAFVMAADDYEDFARSILHKLVREIVPPVAMHGPGEKRTIVHRAMRREGSFVAN